MSDSTVRLLVSTAEDAHASGDLWHVARISWHLAALGYRLSDPTALYGRYTCYLCNGPWAPVYSGRLALSRCSICYPPADQEPPIRYENPA